MDSSNFEFVKTDAQDVNIKNEPFDEMLAPEVKLFTDSGDVGKSKCGEIFTLNSGNFVLICAFCNAEFENMRSFGSHVRDKHEGGCAEMVAMDISALTPTATTTAIKHPPQEVEKDSIDNILGGHFDAQDLELPTKKESSEQENVKATEGEEVLQTFDEDDNIGDNDGDDESFKVPSEASCSEFSEIEEDSKTGKGAGSLKCDSCNRKYKNKRTLYRHQKTTGCTQDDKPADPELFCVPCNRQLKTKKTFARHKKAHENRIKKELDENSGVEEGNSAKSKSDTVQDPSLFCEFCNRYFKTRSNLRTHAERHDTIPIALQGDPEFLKCKFCDEPCPDYAARKTHESTHSGDHPYICKICHKTFATIYKKNIHVALHTGERPHQCPQCPNAYLTKRDVLRHITYRHLNVRRFKCDLCDKSCYRKTELAIHMRRHTGEKPYVCEDCGNSFAALSQLKSHQLRHTQTKNFKCDQCGRFFYSSTSLKDHQASHSDAKPFGCDVCGRRFPRAKALKKHKKLHSDVKAYVCNICGKAYAQDSGLYAHKKSHGLFSNPQGNNFC